MSEVKAHAKLSASGSERWLNCPGSIPLSELAPPKEDSTYALEGTEAHECLEFYLKNHGKDQVTISKMATKRWSLEMSAYAAMAYKEIISRMPPGAILLCETKVDLTFVGPDMFGTVDAAIIDTFGRLWVFDYKYGAGIPVDPDYNTQMLYYALGIAHKYNFEFEDTCLVIIQPRADHEKGFVREWVLGMGELESWEAKFKKGVAATTAPMAPLCPGSWCKFCPADVICPAISDNALSDAQIDFAPEETAEIVLPIPNMIYPEKLSNTLTAINKIETWIDAVKAHALFVMERGVKVPGFKLVNKRSTRKWIESKTLDADAYNKFGESAFSIPELLSPAQFGKKAWPNDLAAKFLEGRITNQSSGITLVPESDKRPEVNQIENDFGPLSVDEGDRSPLLQSTHYSQFKLPSKEKEGVSVKPKKTTKKKPTKKTTKRK